MKDELRKYLVELNRRTEIPNGAIEKGIFLFPFMEYIGRTKEFDPTIGIRDGAYSNDYIIIFSRKSKGRDEIYIDTDGRIYVDPAPCRNCSLNSEEIKELIEKLPAMWKWGMDVRKGQDEVLSYISNLLPGWKISFTERDRKDFSSLKNDYLPKMEELTRRYKRANEPLPLVKECSMWKVEDILVEEWHETKIGKERDRKREEETRKREEKENKERKKDFDRIREESLKTLKKAGLI